MTIIACGVLGRFVRLPDFLQKKNEYFLCRLPAYSYFCGWNQDIGIREKRT